MKIELERPLLSEIGLVSQWFGENLADYSKWGMAGHNGLDYAWDPGDKARPGREATLTGELVFAAHAGQAEVGEDPAGYGLYVRVMDLEAGYVTLYGHLAGIWVKSGQEVLRLQQIGLVGSTGFSTGPHLHFGLKLLKGRNPAYLGWVDPAPFRVGV